MRTKNGGIQIKRKKKRKGKGINDQNLTAIFKPSTCRRLITQQERIGLVAISSKNISFMLDKIIHAWKFSLLKKEASELLITKL